MFCLFHTSFFPQFNRRFKLLINEMTTFQDDSQQQEHTEGIIKELLPQRGEEALGD